MLSDFPLKPLQNRNPRKTKAAKLTPTGVGIGGIRQRG